MLERRMHYVNLTLPDLGKGEQSNLNQISRRF